MFKKNNNGDDNANKQKSTSINNILNNYAF